MKGRVPCSEINEEEAKKKAMFCNRPIVPTLRPEVTCATPLNDLRQSENLGTCFVSRRVRARI